MVRNSGMERDMAVSTLERIETDIAQLSFADQLLLMERLAQRIRKQASPLPISDLDLAEMAVDPAIQQEIQQIEAEFAVADMDGLEREQ